MIKSIIKLSLFSIFLIMMIFSLSSVSAADDLGNETVVVDNQNTDIPVVFDGNSTYSGNVMSNVSSGSSNGDLNIVTPVAELSLKSSDEGINNYADVSVEYNDYYVDVNNKYSFLTMSQGFKNNSPTDISDNIIDIMAYAKNNRLIINLNLLNVSDEIELRSVDDLAWNFIDFLLSSFKSLFN